MLSAGDDRVFFEKKRSGIFWKEKVMTKYIKEKISADDDGIFSEKKRWGRSIFWKEKMSADGPVLHSRSRMIGGELDIKSIMNHNVRFPSTNIFTAVVCTINVLAQYSA